MSNDTPSQDLLEKMKSIHRQQTEVLEPPPEFSASVMRSIRQEAGEPQMSALDTFLWRMTIVPASGALLLFLFAFSSIRGLDQGIMSLIAEISPVSTALMAGESL